MKMKKEYCKPDTWLINLMSPYALLKQSTTVIPGGGAGEGGFDNTWASRDGFWEDIDEDLLEDMDKDDINDLD